MEHGTDTAADAPAERADGPRRLWRTRAERKADAARAAIDEQRARRQADRERLEAETEQARLRATLAEQSGKAAEQRRTQRRTVRQRISMAVVLAAANVGVNGAAVVGQVLALVYGLNWAWWQAAPLAAVVESVAINIGYFAHDKMIKGYSAWGLRLLSYGIGAGVGWFNYSHNSGLETGEFAGVFGAASVLSPVLWQIYSQWRHWDTMRAEGLLEQRPLRFPLLRWVIPSLRGETWTAFKHGIAEGLRSPEVALAEVRAGNAIGNAEQAVREAQQALIGVQSDALRLSLTHLAGIYHDLDPENPEATQAREQIARFMDRFAPLVPPLDTPARSPQGSEPSPIAFPDPETDPETRRPSEQDNQAAREFVKKSIRYRKTVPTAAAVGDEFRFSKAWGYDRILETKREMIEAGWFFPEEGPPVSPTEAKRVLAESSPRSRRTAATATVNGNAPAGGEA